MYSYTHIYTQHTEIDNTYTYTDKDFRFINSLIQTNKI